MNKIFLVYQDCALCGDRGRVRKIEIQDAFDKGYEVVKMPFTNPMAGELIHKALFEHKIEKMPFYTDGVRFTSTIAEIIAKPVEKSVEVEKPKKTKKAPAKKATTNVNQGLKPFKINTAATAAPIGNVPSTDKSGKSRME